MVTISSILSSWLMSNQDYTEGVDIFQRLSKDKAQLSHFLRFQSHLTEARLKEEIEKLYREFKQTAAVQGHETDPTDTLIRNVRLLLDLSASTGDNMIYFEGVDLLENITGDNSLAAFFNHHISKYGWVQLRKALQSLVGDVETEMALRKQKKATPLTIVDHLRAWLLGDRDYLIGVELFSKVTTDLSLISFFKSSDTPDGTSSDTPYRRKRLHDELELAFNELRTRQKQDPSASLVVATPAVAYSAEGPVDTLPAAESELTIQEDEDPGQEDDISDQTDSTQEDSTVPDAMLGYVINNLRKSLSKLRLKEQTPDRVAIIRKNEERLHSLVQRKNSFAQAN